MDLNQINEIIESYRDKKIAVIGDMMLDHYLWGKVERISPEAPVPVIDVEREEYRLGGAANVVFNLKALNAIPFTIGTTGNDMFGDQIFSILEEKGIEKSFLLRDKRKPTTRKSRIIGHHQQVVRVDYESRDDIDKELEDKIINAFQELISQIDGVIIEDYNKGLLTARVIEEIMKTATMANKPITVDPKFKNFFLYRNATIFKPNFNELQRNTGLPIESEEDFDYAARVLMHKLSPEYLIITRGEKGLVIFTQKGDRIDIPTFAQEVYDVSGAGDTVISTLTLGLCSGVDIEKAAIIANHAAGAVCGKIGIQPAYPEDIINSFRSFNKS
ncbi:MAG: D-glycero-beta-D-manno-heptose-7-phosphate kinase [Candidatus Cloacimonetes bacterium]|nr:D-glycero-beta-D-manno-heptose-7-phosphate kinase [Candidatus Cloacimonadota bacterium]